ncbi:hypothetical protein MMC10_007307 [Thelotrema lepadinum]|nr:hypothetical protein [Thelotrema lepadinum]
MDHQPPFYPIPLSGARPPSPPDSSSGESSFTSDYQGWPLFARRPPSITRSVPIALSASTESLAAPPEPPSPSHPKKPEPLEGNITGAPNTAEVLPKPSTQIDGSLEDPPTQKAPEPPLEGVASAPNGVRALLDKTGSTLKKGFSKSCSHLGLRFKQRESVPRQERESLRELWEELWRRSERALERKRRGKAKEKEGDRRDSEKDRDRKAKEKREVERKVREAVFGVDFEDGDEDEGEGEGEHGDEAEDDRSGGGNGEEGLRDSGIGRRETRDDGHVEDESEYDVDYENEYDDSNRRRLYEEDLLMGHRVV